MAVGPGTPLLDERNSFVMPVSGPACTLARWPYQNCLTATESASRLERKRARNRDALLAAARRLFIRDGFERTTIAAIAEEADLGFGTFYRYFPDKESALHAVLEEAAREVDAVLLTEDDPAVPATAALTGLTRRFARAARTKSGRVRPVVAARPARRIKGASRPRRRRAASHEAAPGAIAHHQPRHTVRRIRRRRCVPAGRHHRQRAHVPPGTATRRARKRASCDRNALQL